MATADRRRSPRLSRSRFWVGTALFVVVFLVMLDLSVVEVAIPVIRTDLNTSIEGIQWILNGYEIAFASLLLLGGRIGSRSGFRSAFIGAAAVFTLGSVLCAVAPDLAVLVVGRAVQGAAAAVVVPVGLALLDGFYTEPAAKTRAIGLWSALNGIAVAAGPLLGGVIVDHASWRIIFVPNIPLVAGAIFLARRALPAGTQSDAPLGYASSVLSIAWIALITYALSTAPARGWTSPVTVAFIIAAMLLAAIFLVLQYRLGPDALLPLRFFRTGTFALANAAALAIGFVPVTMFVVLMLYFQQARGWSAAVSGAAFLPVAAGMSLGAPLAGWLRRTGQSGTLAVGLGVTTAAVLSLAFAGTSTPFAALVAPLVAFGAGTGMAMTAANGGAMEGIDDPAAGAAVVNMSLEAGGALGVAVLVSILDSRYLAELTGALRQAGPSGAAALRMVAALRGGPPTRGTSAAVPAAQVHMAVTAYVGAIRVVFAIGAVLLAVMLSAVVVGYAIRRGRPQEAAAARPESTGERVSGEAN